jgi:glycosyltransferase involved in cell wall biosynthesis
MYPGFALALPIWLGLSAKVRALDLDLFHAHHPFLLGATARRLATRLRRPLVFTYHTRYEKYAHYVPFIQRVVQRKAIDRSVRFSNRADLVIAPSHGAAKLIHQLGVTSRVEVVPTGVDLKRFTPGDRLLARHRLELPSGASILLYVGRLDREKNLEFLLRAFEGIAYALPAARLVLVGSGTEAERLKRVASELRLDQKILFVGSVPQERTADYYRAADLFVFTSETETQGLVIAEAHASGLPVVAVRACGVDEVVRDGETGLLLSASIGAFASAIRALLMDEPRCRQMGLAARAVADKEFPTEQSVARHIELYHELHEQHEKGR